MRVCRRGDFLYASHISSEKEQKINAPESAVAEELVGLLVGGVEAAGHGAPHAPGVVRKLDARVLARVRGLEAARPSNKVNAEKKV